MKCVSMRHTFRGTKFPFPFLCNLLLGNAGKGKVRRGGRRKREGERGKPKTLSADTRLTCDLTFLICSGSDDGGGDVGGYSVLMISIYTPAGFVVVVLAIFLPHGQKQ